MDQKDENPIIHLDLRTPEQWSKVKGIHIVDPDGWREEGSPSWETPITEREYLDRAAVSSLKMNVADQSPFYSEVAADLGTPAGYRAPRGARRADTAPVALFPNSDAELEEKQREAFVRHANMGLTHGIGSPGVRTALEAISDVLDDEAATADTPDNDGDLEMDDPGRER